MANLTDWMNYPKWIFLEACDMNSMILDGVIWTSMVHMSRRLFLMTKMICHHSSYNYASRIDSLPECSEDS